MGVLNWHCTVCEASGPYISLARKSSSGLGRHQWDWVASPAPQFSVIVSLASFGWNFISNVFFLINMGILGGSLLPLLHLLPSFQHYPEWGLTLEVAEPSGPPPKVLRRSCGLFVASQPNPHGVTLILLAACDMGDSWRPGQGLLRWISGIWWVWLSLQ